MKQFPFVLLCRRGSSSVEQHYPLSSLAHQEENLGREQATPMLIPKPYISKAAYCQCSTELVFCRCQWSTTEGSCVQAALGSSRFLHSRSSQCFWGTDMNLIPLYGHTDCIAISLDSTMWLLQGKLCCQNLGGATLILPYHLLLAFDCLIFVPWTFSVIFMFVYPMLLSLC